MPGLFDHSTSHLGRPITTPYVRHFYGEESSLRGEFAKGRKAPTWDTAKTYIKPEVKTHPPGPGVVTTSSESERGPDGRPSHFSSTVYKSPYGKVYRFNSHY